MRITVQNVMLWAVDTRLRCVGKVWVIIRYYSSFFKHTCRIKDNHKLKL